MQHDELGRALIGIARQAIAAELGLANGERDLWLHELASDRSSRFTFDRSVDARGILSADGARVVFRANRGASAALYIKAASGVGTESLLAPVPLSAVPRDWSFDGQYILYQAIDP